MSASVKALITPELEARFAKVVARYPADQKQSAVIPLLHIFQEVHGGSLTHEHQLAVAHYLSVPVTKVHEVTTFYSMYSLEARGKNHISICRTLPCALMGCETIVQTVHDKLKVEAKEVTADGKFSYEEVECLAMCHLAPMVQVGEEVYGNLTVESTQKLIDKLGAK
jgi:NADH-quinone oxidoreductase subunit E